MSDNYSAFTSSGASSVLYGMDSAISLDDDDDNSPARLTAKPHAFAGAVLSPKHARELSPVLCLAIAAALSEQQQSHRKTVVPYTLWITEAWRILGWAEPSAALFWEMATMYHTLYLANRAQSADYYDQNLNNIPPILSCGSNSSLGSGTTHQTDRQAVFDKKKFSTAASAKELPVWFVGTFLLLHCEEFAYQRNLAGQDERRFFTGMEPVLKSGGKVDFTSLLKNSSLSPRTRLHAGWLNDNSHCTAYVLRHLRKVLLLVAVPHNQEAVNACMHLAALSSTAPAASHEARSSRRASQQSRKAPEELERQHEEEHAQVGLNVTLTLDDLERLNLLLQPPHGGGIDDAPVRIGEVLWSALRKGPPSPMATLSMAEVEREIRRHLEDELLSAGQENDDEKEDVSDDEESARNAMAKMNLAEGKGGADANAAAAQRAKQPKNQFQKELSYTRLRGTTILLKPNHIETSSGASAGSNDVNVTTTPWSAPQRLHDLAIADCSDAHFYLLQPFVHATISGCTGCTIVVGAVAGLLHVVDCEKTNITSSARRILVSNSCDVQMCIFSPSPPLLVGDNRSCQFAPYNTFYDGLREDLLATGLAAAVVSENQSPYHGATAKLENDAAWPPLQCASNKWKLPIELSKLEMPQIPNSSAPSSPGSTGSGPGSSPGADDKAMGKPGAGNDATMHAPVLVPASEFHILFVPFESEVSKQRREAEDSEAVQEGGPMESQYCRLLAEVLQLSPFRLPVEYERRAIMKADRIRNIQQTVQKNLTPEQQIRFEEELNQGFRDWLVTSGNLRQVLDLVHLDRRGGA